MPRSGRLRHKVEIQSSTASQDAMGQPVKTWATHGYWWCNLAPQRGQERVRSDAIQAPQAYVFQGRHIDGVTAQMRIVWNSKTYDIQSVINVNERDRMTEILATEGEIEVNG